MLKKCGRGVILNIFTSLIVIKFKYIFIFLKMQKLALAAKTAQILVNTALQQKYAKFLDMDLQAKVPFVLMQHRLQQFQKLEELILFSTADVFGLHTTNRMSKLY